MKRFITLFFLSAFLLLMSCEEEIAFNGSDLAPKLVVNCLIAQDSTFVAQVKHSISITNTRYDRNYVNNANVKLYENSQFVGLLVLDTVKAETNSFNEPQFAYTLNGFKATAGNSYKLEVDVPNYESVSAQITIPKPVQIVRLDTSIITVRESWGGENRYINFAVYFKDPPAERNFYRIVIRKKTGTFKSWINYPNYYNVQVIQSIPLVKSNDISINPTGSSNEDLFDAAPNNSMVFSDDLFDGKDHAISVFTRNDYTYYSTLEFREFTIELHAISKEYYLYAKSLSLFYSKNDDPFAEPVQVYSNIEKGFGIFAGYSIAKEIFLDGVYPAEGADYFYE